MMKTTLVVGLSLATQVSAQSVEAFQFHADCNTTLRLPAECGLLNAVAEVTEANVSLEDGDVDLLGCVDIGEAFCASRIQDCPCLTSPGGCDAFSNVFALSFSAPSFGLQMRSESLHISPLGGNTMATHDHVARLDVRVSEPLMATVNVSFTVAWESLQTFQSSMQFSGPSGRASYGASAVSISDSISCTGCADAPPERTFGEHVILWPGTYTLLVTTNASESSDVASGVFTNVTLPFLGGTPIPMPTCQVPGEPCGDVNNDGGFDGSDLVAWAGSPIDTNGDGSVDPDPYGDDASWLAVLLEGVGLLGDDCNQNGFPDDYDLSVDPAALDICNCVADWDASGTLDVTDLLGFLSQWFVLDPATDIDGTAGVAIGDLLAFLAVWFADCAA